MGTSYPRIQIASTALATQSSDSVKRDLILGNLVTGATATPGVVIEDVQNLSTTNLKSLFNEKSNLYNEIIRYIDASNRTTRLDVKALAEDGSATAATAVVTITGTATEEGILKVYPVSRYDYSVEIGINVGDTASEIGALLTTLLNDHESAPFNAANSTGVVTLTSVDKSTIPNFWTIGIDESVPAGISVALTGWAGGVGVFDVSTILDGFENIQHWGVLWPQAWFSSIDVLKDFLETRQTVSNRVLFGVGFVGMAGDVVQVGTDISTRDDKVIYFGGSKIIDNAFQKGTAIIEPASWLWADFMGKRSRRSSLETIISDIVFSGAYIDQFGGPQLASIPYSNTPIKAVATSYKYDFLPDEIQTLEEYGYTCFQNDNTNSRVIIGRVNSTFKLNTAGESSDVFKTLNAVDTYAEVATIIFNDMQSKMKQARLSTNPNRSINRANVITAGVIKALFMASYNEASTDGLVEGASEYVQRVSRSFTVNINVSAGSVQISSLIFLMGQVRAVDLVLAVSQ